MHILVINPVSKLLILSSQKKNLISTPIRALMPSASIYFQSGARPLFLAPAVVQQRPWVGNSFSPFAAPRPTVDVENRGFSTSNQATCKIPLTEDTYSSRIAESAGRGQDFAAKDDLHGQIKRTQKTIVFVEMKRKADFLVARLCQDDFNGHRIRFISSAIE